MSAPHTPNSAAWPTRPTGRQRRSRRLGLLAVALTAVLVASAPAAGAAWQEPTSTLPGQTTTTLPGTTPGETATTTADGGQAGAGIDVIPRVVDLVFRTTKVSGGKDTATVSEAPGATEVALAADVLFAFDSDRLTPVAKAELADTARLIRERAKGPIRVEGHTDAIGSPSYNQDLSQRRAQAVRDALAGLLTDRLTQFRVRGFGASKPVAANKNPDGSDNPKGRAKNRRVSVVFTT
jgi:outer membrane protein OmpA-like peptidoglycan-associated protein